MPPKKKQDTQTNPPSTDLTTIKTETFVLPDTPATKEKDDSGLDTLKTSGIPVKRAQFHSTVLSAENTPEYAFYAKGGSTKKSRTASMWYTPHGLLTEQTNKSGKGTQHKLIPLANISDTDLL